MEKVNEKKSVNPIHARIDVLKEEIACLQTNLKASVAREKRWSENVDKLLSFLSNDIFTHFSEQQQREIIGISIDCDILALSNVAVFENVFSRASDKDKALFE